ncbi:hypothetical protein HMPREF1321_1617 [Capnocytophaga sp. oral taxon 412 str. F0487]|uniref:RipA family octameric membrane protein n=1 Tax=Capnocytophaga sp. oral taxon 412 TaxID=712218 RepID=UPI00026969E4|nr:hypothetical protein [Capnocytophaga sp. oral taxon 412]EIW91658.1 hypothetical protein HMPREF1321_1617 [Capnocytophaga sp. oral taxon 412 str. F0487]
MENNQEMTNQQENSSLNNTSVDGCKEFTPLERYKTLIAARNFHYDNFNKWLSYFYIAIGTLFIGFCTLKTSDKSSLFELEIIMILILGYIISLLWFLSCKGYYFWNINFITLVNNCEKDLKPDPKERVYFVFANKKRQNNYFNPISGANISTSKVAILFSFIITISWGILLLKEFMKFIDDRCLSIVLHILGVILIPIITLSLSYISQLFLQSKIDHFPDLKLQQTKED